MFCEGRNETKTNHSMPICNKQQTDDGGEHNTSPHTTSYNGSSWWHYGCSNNAAMNVVMNEVMNAVAAMAKATVVAAATAAIAGRPAGQGGKASPCTVTVGGLI